MRRTKEVKGKCVIGQMKCRTKDVHPLALDKLCEGQMICETNDMVPRERGILIYKILDD